MHAHLPRLLAGALAAALLAGAARADDLDDAIERATIKDRAGRAAEALDIVEALSATHDGDPRLHFARYQFLKNLQRPEEAADALDRAVDAQAAYAPPAGGEAAYADLQKRITAEAKEVLRFRIPARDALAAYRKDGLAFARALLDGGKARDALYVLGELAQVADDRRDADAIEKMRDEVAAEVREAYAQAAQRRAQAAAAPGGDPKRADRNADDAAKALAAKRYDEARLAALASLEDRPVHAGTLATLAEALEGLSRIDEAVDAAVRAIDSPLEPKAPLSQHARALRVLRTSAPALGSFLEQRAVIAKAVLAQAQKARAAKREPDAQWLEALAQRVAPADPGVQRALADRAPAGGAVARRGGGERAERPERPPALEKGFADLLQDPSAWRWRLTGPEAGVANGEVVLTGSSEASLGGTKLAPKFTLRFEMRMDTGTDSGAGMFVIFGAEAQSRRALIFVPNNGHNVGFARFTDWWHIGEAHPLPDGVPAPGAWHRCEIAWSAQTRRLVMTIDGKPSFDCVLPEADRLDGGELGLMCGKVERVRLRRLSLKNEG